MSAHHYLWFDTSAQVWRIVEPGSEPHYMLRQLVTRGPWICGYRYASSEWFARLGSKSVSFKEWTELHTWLDGLEESYGIDSAAKTCAAGVNVPGCRAG